MRFGTKTLLAVIIIVAIPLVLLPHGCDMMMQFDRQLHRRVQKLENGAAKAEVFALLGEPIESCVECCLPQQKGFEKEFAKAQKSPAVAYFLWRNGVNWYYCIGFNENDEVVVVLEGCS